MICKKCGTKNKDGMKFCKNCGAKLQADNYDVYSDENLHIDTSKSKSPKWLIISIIVVTLAIIGVIVFLIISHINDNSQNKPNDKIIATTSVMDADSEETTAAITTNSETQFQTTNSLISVPNIVGMKSSDAYNKITDLGLKYKAEFEYSDDIPEDYVISQKPTDKEKADIGDTVTIKISRGTKPENSSNYSSSSKTSDFSSNTNIGDKTTDRYGLNASSCYISRSDISWMTLDEIQLSINEIYAKLGYRFSKGTYKTYFESMDWYHPDTQDMNVIEKRMNNYEYENIKIMGAYRDSLSN